MEAREEWIFIEMIREASLSARQRKSLKIQNFRVDKNYTRLADIYDITYSKKNTKRSVLITYLLEEGEWKVNQITWCGREDVCETEEEKRFKKNFWLTVEKCNK